MKLWVRISQKEEFNYVKGVKSGESSPSSRAKKSSADKIRKLTVAGSLQQTLSKMSAEPHHTAGHETSKSIFRYVLLFVYLYHGRD
ncbi:hypothetical protein RRG08_014980 [Elysia crispata]|uniref:Uncharacterized protein n=1 Tax=Elysia crispata TaxID=231223 RepID=A0AAE0ZW95_9GAST|nr:hypothetical protein RRG08_014980 [Elysia crispata]